MSRRVMIVAGEASSDEYGALMARELFKLVPGLSLSGIGGPALAAAGAELLYPPEEMREMALVGITEVAAKAVYAWRGMRNCRDHLRRVRPDLLILMDLPAFNFRLARHARRLGIRTLYYFPPQVWGWGAWRAAKLSRLVDGLAVAFPFEKAFYAARAPALPVTFVGHPELDVAEPSDAGDWPFAEDDAVIGLLPGSRLSEIRHHMPLLAGAVERISRQRPDVRFALPVAPGLDASMIEPYLAASPGVALLTNASRTVMRKACLLLACSGTATLQAAVRKTPMAIFYRMGRVNAFVGRRLMLVRHLGMPNLIYGGDLVPEFIQERATPAALADAALAMLRDPARMAAMAEGLETVGKSLGGPGASRRTAELAASMLEPSI